MFLEVFRFTKKHRIRVEGPDSLYFQGGGSIRLKTPNILKKNLNASKPSVTKPSEHPPQVEVLGGNIGCRDKTSSWYQKGSPM